MRFLSNLDALEKSYIRFPQFDVIYLDYTCKFKTIEPDIALILQGHETFLKPIALLHLTVSKRAVARQNYQKQMRDYIDIIERYAYENSISVRIIRNYDTVKMFKIDVLLEKSTDIVTALVNTKN